MVKKIIRPKFDVDTQVEHIKNVYVTAELLIEEGNKQFNVLNVLSLLEVPDELVDEGIRDFLFGTINADGYYVVLVGAEIKFNKDFEMIEDEGIKLSIIEVELFSKPE